METNNHPLLSPSPFEIKPAARKPSPLQFNSIQFNSSSPRRRIRRRRPSHNHNDDHHLSPAHSQPTSSHRRSPNTITNNLREPFSPEAYISLLQSCIDARSLHHGRRIHAALPALHGAHPFLATKLVSMYAKCGSLHDARRVFNELRQRNLFAWSAMVNACVRERRWEEVVALFYQMMADGLIPDGFLLPKFLQACANTGDIRTGRLLHSLALRCGLIDSSHVGNSILAMYAKCGQLSTAKRFFEKMTNKDRVTWNSIISGHCQCGEEEEGLRLFERMRTEGIEPGLVTWNILIATYNQCGHPERAMELMKQMQASGIAPDVFTWTSVISGFAKNNKTGEALDLFQKMQLSGVEPNGVTVASAISACASLKALRRGKELHCFAIKTGGVGSVLVGNSLVDMYAKCGRLERAHGVFDAMSEKDVFTWNSMIGGYARAGYCGKAYELFSKMEDLGVRRNVVTWNVMISAYIQNGDEDQALELFQRVDGYGIKRNTATWNVLITGCVKNGHANKALKIFRQMLSVSERPNSVTILSVLPACSNLVSVRKVKEIHACVLRIGLNSDVSISNAFIDAYSKSGEIRSAREVFNGLQSRDLISWNAMIAGCVLHGLSQVAEDLFHRMKQEGAKPNQATFASMIYAFSLSGLVSEGKELFSSMIEEYRLSPRLDHYSGMVNLLGRAGRFREASDLIENMPIEPDCSVWTALLTAARIYGNIKFANLAAEQLVKLEPRNSEARRLLLHLHALSGKTRNVSNKREPKENNNNEFHGCCWIEVKNKVYTFLKGERTSEDSESNFAELNKMTEKVKLARHDIPDTKLDFEEEKEEIASIHSEKLAIAFALANSPHFQSIRVIKSIRMCTDCHSTIKAISKVYQREILLKDPKNLHHFKNGKCSCGDYW